MTQQQVDELERELQQFSLTVTITKQYNVSGYKIIASNYTGEKLDLVKQIMRQMHVLSQTKSERPLSSAS